jgi:hypothetical protein
MKNKTQWQTAQKFFIEAMKDENGQTVIKRSFHPFNIIKPIDLLVFI